MKDREALIFLFLFIGLIGTTMELLEGKTKTKIGLVSQSGEILGYVEIKKEKYRDAITKLTQLIEFSKVTGDARIYIITQDAEFVDFESVKEISEKEEKAVLREASDVVI